MTMLDTAAGLVQPIEAAHVLWYFASGLGEKDGLEPGTFTVRLIAAIAAADPQNRGRLSVVFPGYALAVTLAQDVDDGMEILSTLADRLTSR